MNQKIIVQQKQPDASMLNKKGQALVEFIIILPVFIFLVFGLIDFGKIIYIKNELTILLPDIEEMYKKNNAEEEITKMIKKNNKDNVLDIKLDEKYITFKISRDLNIITPGLNKIIGNPYKISEALVIENDKG